MRRAIKALLQLLPDHNAIFFIAPTGYGKTLASPLILREALQAGKSAGLIHVAPLKTLVRKIFEEKFARSGFKTGYQSQDVFEEEDKTPFFMRELVVTTLDSFMMNLYKMPVAEIDKILLEKTAGHYHTSLSFILTSTIVFDEAHVYTGGVDESISIDLVYAGVSFLSYLKTPIIVETATMNTKVIEAFAGVIAKAWAGEEQAIPVVYVSCGGVNPQIDKLSGNHLLDLVRVEDPEYCKSNTIDWKTSFPREEEALKKAVENAESGKTVLIVRNTVEKALKTYKTLKGKTGSEMALIHGRMSVRDRENALERMNSIMRNGGIIVSTQVIEAGVESNASVLITDPAPIENLVQRAGRLCREGSAVYETCREEGGEVSVIYPETWSEESQRFDVYTLQRVRKTIEELKSILDRDLQVDWRLPDSTERRIGFAEIMEKIEPPLQKNGLAKGGEALLKQYLICEASFSVFKDLASILGLNSVVRDSIQLNMLIPLEKSSLRGDYFEASETRGVDFISIDAGWFFRKEAERMRKGEKTCLEYRGDQALIAKKSDNTGLRFKLSKSKRLTRRFVQEASYLEKSLKLWEVPYVYMDEAGEEYQYLILNPECYSMGEGLLIV